MKTKSVLAVFAGVILSIGCHHPPRLSLLNGRVCEVFAPESIPSYPMIQVAIDGKPLLVGTHEVTQGLWSSIMNTNPTPSFLGCDPMLPVVSFSIVDVANFANAMSSRTNIDRYYSTVATEPRIIPEHFQGFRVPRPAEWRSLVKSVKLSSDDICTMGNVADLALHRHIIASEPWEPMIVVEKKWKCDDGQGLLAPVGNYHSVDGVFDLIGNVTEWCWDIEDNGNVFARSCGTSFQSGRDIPVDTQEGSHTGLLAGVRLVRSL